MTAAVADLSLRLQKPRASRSFMMFIPSALLPLMVRAEKPPNSSIAIRSIVNIVRASVDIVRHMSTIDRFVDGFS